MLHPRSLSICHFAVRYLTYAPNLDLQDTRNIARLVVELARRGWKLEPNTPINPNRRWPWMGKRGRVLEEYYP